jgi:hypothetical protein
MPPEPDTRDCELGMVECELDLPDCEETAVTALAWWVVCDARLLLLPPQPAIATASPSGKLAFTRLDNMLPRRESGGLDRLDDHRGEVPPFRRSMTGFGTL